MTHKKLNYLLVSLISLLLCLLIFSTSARAGGPIAPEIEWSAGGFVVGKVASGAGYKPGIGLNLIGAIKYKLVELRVNGSAAWQEKKQATFGYTYSLVPSLRFYVWEDWFLTSAYSIAGYTSYMKSGAEWSKVGKNLGFGAGYDDGKTGIALISYLQETTSPNNVTFTNLHVRQQVWEWFAVTTGVTYMTFDQPFQGIVERRSSWNLSVGAGFYF